MNIAIAYVLSFLVVSCLSSAASAASLQRIATGFNAPVYVTAPPEDPSRIFILEKDSGQVRIVRLSDNQIVSQPFLSVADISNGGERGLLGLAFAPNYASSGVVYVSVTNSQGDSELRRYQPGVNADQADSNSGEVLLTIPQPASNHNGGWIGFGPDGFLYMSSGDGGDGNDPANNGQDLTTLLGTMLRIDISGDDFPSDNSRNYRIPASNPFVGVLVNDQPARGEIWAYGLRNPWRPSFDRQTGDLFIADVGQGAREEVNFQLANSAGGENYGWRLREGDIATPSVGGDKPADNVDPIYAYQRNGSVFSGQSITGGYRYRGPAAELRGLYFFADFANGRIWSLQPNVSSFTNLVFQSPQLIADQGEVNNVASFGEDSDGNLYVVDFDGDIFRLKGASVSNPNPNPTPNPVRNQNAVVPAITLLLED